MARFFTKKKSQLNLQKITSISCHNDPNIWSFMRELILLLGHNTNRLREITSIFCHNYLNMYGPFFTHFTYHILDVINKWEKFKLDFLSIFEL